VKGSWFYRFYKVIGWSSIILAGILCGLRIATPLFTPSVPQLSAWVAKQLQYPTHIQELKFSWEGLSPAVALSGVEILSEDKKTSLLNIGKMKLRLDVLQLFLARLQLDELVIENASLGIEYQNGHLRVLNLPQLQLNLQDLSSGPQQAIISKLFIKDSTIHLTVNAEKTSLFHTDLAIEAKNILKIRGNASVAGKNEGHIQVGADIPLWGSKEAEVYLHLQDIAWTTLKPFLPVIPISIENGDLDLEAWLKIKDQHSMELTTRFEFNDIDVKSKGKEQRFNFVRGDLATQFEDKHWKIIGKDWQLASPDVSTEKMNFTANSALSPEGMLWEIKANDANLAFLNAGIEIMPKSSELSQKIQAHYPRGQLDYLHVIFLAKGQQLTPKLADIVFSNLQIEADNKLPGFSGLSGAVTFTGQNARMALQSEHVQIHFPTLYSYPIEITDLNTVLNGYFLENDLMIKAAILEANLFDTAFSGQGTWHFKGKEMPTTEMVFNLGTMKTATALTLLPRKMMDEDLVSWLDNALLSGNVLSTTCVLRGNLAEFPFDNAEGVFEIYTELENAHLDYTKGWPALTDLKANLLFRNRSLFISAESGALASESDIIGQLVDADAVIPNLAADLPVLILDTKVASTLGEGLTVIHKSPLEASLGKTLAPLNFEGRMALSLGLEVPLSMKEEHKVKVRGLIEVQNASVNLKEEWDFPVSELQGNVSFTEDSVKSDYLSGKFLGTPTRFSIETNTTGSTQVQVTAQGKVDLQQLPKKFHLQEIPQIQGETDYTALLAISPDNINQGNLTLTSTLQGVAIDAPYPFAKEAEEARPFECKINFDPNELMRLAVKYGDGLNMTYSFTQRNKTWQTVGGHIHFGENRLAKYREDQVLLIDGGINAVDVEKWKAFFATVGLLSEKQSTTSFTLEPLIELNIEDFNLYGFSFPQEKIEAQWDGKAHQWNFNFQGPALSGHVIVPQEENQAIMVNLQKLTLTKGVDLSEPTSTEEMPNKKSLDIKIKELTLNNKVFTDIQTRLEPSWKGYFSPDFKAKMKNTDISLSGSWDYLSTHKKVFAEGKIETKNISDTLNALGITGSIRNAKGTIGFSVQWNGTPGKIDLGSLNGQADLALNRGMINGVNPGMGRVLSLLNLDNVHRRLNLDFSDVTKNGLTFDELDGKFKFGKGKISSNKVILKSPTVKIEAFGQADLENQALDGEMIVMPDLTGSLPVAAAIASANPAVGAAVWVVDKMFGNKIQQIHRLRYKVLGTWQSPLVEEVPIMTARRG